MSKKKQSPNDRGFFLSVDGREFHLRPAKGDKMIQPEEEEERSQGRSQSTYGEVSAYRAAKVRASDGHGRWEKTTSTGGVQVEDRGRTTRKSNSGEPGGHTHHVEPPRREDLPQLSDSARRLFHRQNVEAEEWLKEKLAEEGKESVSGKAERDPNVIYPYPEGPPSLAEDGIEIENLGDMARRVKEKLAAIPDPPRNPWWRRR